MTGCYILAETYKNFANNDLADFWVVNFPPAYHQALLVSSGKTLKDQKDRYRKKGGKKKPRTSAGRKIINYNLKWHANALGYRLCYPN